MKTVCRGPVRDLEKYVKKDWWKTYFSEIYLKADGDFVENIQNTRRDVDRLIDVLKISKNQAIADFCCGQGRHSLEFARRGYKNIIGVDASNYLLNLARQRARKARLPVEFFKGNVLETRLPEKKDFIIIMGGSLGYFQSDHDTVRLFRNAFKNLATNGKFAIDVADGDLYKKAFSPFSAEWADRYHIVCRERTLSKDGQRVISRRIMIDTRRGVTADDFYAIDLFTRARIHSLLKKAGFSQVKIRPFVPAKSVFEQDLGLMQNRLLVTARRR